MGEAEFQALVARSRAVYDAMTPEQKADHDYRQRKSFVRGMCPNSYDFDEWCKVVDKLMPARQ